MMPVTIKMLWYSVATEAGVIEYHLPDNEAFFSRLQWRRYQELNELASAYRATITVRDRPRWG